MVGCGQGGVGVPVTSPVEGDPAWSAVARDYGAEVYASLSGAGGIPLCPAEVTFGHLGKISLAEDEDEGFFRSDWIGSRHTFSCAHH